MRPTPAPLVVWRLSDGRRGHDSQSRGLLDALARRTSLAAGELSLTGARRCLLDGRAAPTGAAPDLLIGAGRRTHLPLALLRRRLRARAVVLMRPWLPYGCFDLALVPRHDAPPCRADVVATMGALNPLRPRATGAGRDGPDVVLIGGPSKHFGWDAPALLAQIEALARATPRRLLVTDSPRTPAATRAALARLALPNLALYPYERTPPGWVQQALGAAPAAWVSADSVSMVYEALTAGCHVGVLAVPARRPGRVVAGLEALAAEGWVTPFSHWNTSGVLRAPPRPLAEADRCAALILARWYPERAAGLGS